MKEYFLSRLPNGLRVLSVPMRDRDSSGVGIWVKAGARMESKKLSGASHFLEHMLFKGTKKRSTKQIKEEIEGVGGVLNAFTGEESTCYFSKILVEHYPAALEVLSDMVNNATLDAKEMTKERTVILEEIKMYKDLPSHYVHDLMSELLWPDQPLGRAISGTEKTVSALSRGEVVDYKKAYYHPKNILLSVSGAVKHEDVVKIAGKLFPQNPALRESTFEKAFSKQSRPQAFFLEKQSEQTHFVIGLHGIPRTHPDRYTLALLNVILGSNMSSRLFEEVREKRGLAYEIRSGISFYHDTGAFTVSAGVEKSKAPEALRVILKELSKLRRTLVTEGELRRAKDYFMSQFCMALEDTLEHLLWVGERLIDGADLPDQPKLRRSIESVTREGIREVARRLFVNKNLNFSLIGPIPSSVQSMLRKDLEIDEH